MQNNSVPALWNTYKTTAAGPVQGVARMTVLVNWKRFGPKMRRAEKGQPMTLASVIRINSYARQTVGQFRILKLFIAQPGGAVRSIPLYRSHLMNIFSLSYLLELVKELPDPKEFINANRGRRSVIRLPVRDWD